MRVAKDIAIAAAAVVVLLVIVTGGAAVITWAIGGALDAYCVFTPATKLVICK